MTGRFLQNSSVRPHLLLVSTANLIKTTTGQNQGHYFFLFFGERNVRLGIACCACRHLDRVSEHDFQKVFSAEAL